MSSEALELALALYRAPAQRFVLRDRGLPPDIGQVIRLASGNPELLQHAARRLREPESVVLEAVRFYLQQVLFDPDADAYRVLGLESNAPYERVREHYHWLQRWLHPDRRGDDWDALYAKRVNGAWNHLRNDTARHAYDQAHVASESSTSVVHHPVGGVWMPIPTALPQRNWLRLAVLGVSLTSCVLLLVAVMLREDPSPADWSGAGRSGANEGGSSTAGTGSEPRHRRTPSRQPLAVATAGRAQPNAALPHPTSGSAPYGVRHSPISVPPSPSTHRRRPDAASAPPMAPQLMVQKQMPGSVPALADRSPVARRSKILAGDDGRHRLSARAGRVAAPALAPSGTDQRPAAPALVVAESESPNAAAADATNVGISSAPTPPIARAPQVAAVAPRRDTHTARRSARPTLPTIPIIVAATPAVIIDQTTASVPPTRPTTSPRDMVERIDLARQRVRELAAYFDGTKATLPARWLDAAGQVTTQSLRSSLYARNQLHDSAGFALESPNWYLLHDKVTLSATYRVRRDRKQLEVGRFFVDMTWRAEAWHVSRVALEPAL